METLVTFLKDLQLRADDSDKRAITDILRDIEDDDISSPTQARPSASGSASTSAPSHIHTREHSGHQSDEPSASGPNAASSRAEEEPPLTEGNSRELDSLDEDLLLSKAARETGFVGHNSAVAWLRNLQRDSFSNITGEKIQAGSTPATAETSFYLDGENLDLHIKVDPRFLPSTEHAVKLLSCFVATVHKSFPILPSNFPDQCSKYLAGVRSGLEFEVPNQWLALLNLCFAIGARYSHLISAEWQTKDERDHLTYMARAIHLLGGHGSLVVLSAPDLRLIQATGLMSFYYLAVGHVSRAWVMIGISIRLSMSLGLHLRNEDPSVPPAKKAMLARTWWGLHAIECLLSSITGRPCVLACEDSTVALLNEFADDDALPIGSTKGKSKAHQPLTPSYSDSHTRRIGKVDTYLDAHVSLGLITQQLLATLYAPRVASQPWSYIEKKIPSLLAELEEWRTHALPVENGQLMNPFQPPDGDREYTLLQFYYCSTKILITRPCLCRSERRSNNNGNTTVGFIRTTAAQCIQAAQEMASLLPDQPNIEGLYENTPWWSLVHYIMQALAVLLLELSFQDAQAAIIDPTTELHACVKKLISWLHIMRNTEPVALRAYKVVRHIPQNARHLQASADALLLETETGTYYEQPSHQSPHASMASPMTIDHQASTYNEQASSFTAGGTHDILSSGAQYTNYAPPPTHSQAYTHHSPNATQSPVNMQLLFDMQPQGLSEQFSQLLPQAPPVTQHFSYQYPYQFHHTSGNPSYYSNPFTTGFDQGVDVDAMWDMSLEGTGTGAQGPRFGQQEPRGEGEE
ncbi:hypothetical protein CC80DRAFT_513688 [Byssothecium circinans]|uniref:Xylanolytic transcriptional activator regulatory domain-containing protein n=1 Tax=Byssothecium circinans TaxID=147558 RepID=A0A6A5UB32_9PLEO|nr:hypothetical protein CC80DRAFT_513688 [Byssothecium circinans]